MADIILDVEGGGKFLCGQCHSEADAVLSSNDSVMEIAILGSQRMRYGSSFLLCYSCLSKTITRWANTHKEELDAHRQTSMAKVRL